MRRNVVRQRQEFLERRQREGVHDAIHARKVQLRESLTTGAPIPGHLMKDAVTLKKFVELDDEETAKKTHKTLDDEYALAGVEDPKVLVSTSREASQKLMEFAKEIRLCIPNSVRMNRGSVPISQIMDAARRDKFTDVVVVSESKGVPDTLTISHLPLGPTVMFTIHNLVTRHEIQGTKPMSEMAPHLIFENFTTPLGKRISNVLKYLFPVPKPDATRVLTFDNNSDYISFRHHTFTKKGENVTSLTEVGPRFELQPFRVLLGTMDMADADTEWVLHPYTNTAKKKKIL